MGPPLQSSPYQLRVEGRDDRHCVVHLLGRHGFEWDDDTRDRPYVSYAGGKDELFASLSVTVKGSYERVGFVVDADTEVQDRWIQVRESPQSSRPHPARWSRSNGDDNIGTSAPVFGWSLADARQCESWAARGLSRQARRE